MDVTERQAVNEVGNGPEGRLCLVIQGLGAARITAWRIERRWLLEMLQFGLACIGGKGQCPEILHQVSGLRYCSVNSN